MPPLKIKIVSPETYSKVWDIFIEGEKVCTVHRSIFGKTPKFSSITCLSEWEPLFDKAEYQRVRGYVIWRLSTQSYHSDQIKKLLRERFVREKTINRIIQEFSTSGYFNDEEWLISQIRLLERRYGARAVLFKLKQKGLSSDVLVQARDLLMSSEGEKEAISRLLETKYRAKNLSDFKEKQKVIASLMRKGFSYEVIQNVII